MKFHRLHNLLGPSKAIGSLIILNGPELNAGLVDLLWPLEEYPVKNSMTQPNTNEFPVICADGGANLLYDLFVASSSGSASQVVGRRIPTCIVGDLDSVRPQVVRYYKSMGARVIKDLCEDTNDFRKAIGISEQLMMKPKLPVVVIGGHGGRMDQTLANLNTLYSAAEINKDIFWLDQSNVVLALSSGRHHVSIDPSREGPKCGLIPIGGPVDVVSTQGLRWNLDGHSLAFGNGGLVSSSNEILEQAFVVDTSHPLLWTLEIHLKGP